MARLSAVATRFAAFFICTSCGGSNGARPAAPTERDASAPLATTAASGKAPAPRPAYSVAPEDELLVAALGKVSDATVVTRPFAMRLDPYWAPIVSKILSKPDDPGAIISHTSTSALFGARQIDVHFYTPDADHVSWVAFAYEMPEADPTKLYDGDERPFFVAGGRLSSNVKIYKPAPQSTRALRADVMTPTLFVLPDGTWIATDASLALRMTKWMGQLPAPPVIHDAPHDVLVIATLHREAFDPLRSLSPIDWPKPSPIVATFALESHTEAAVSGTAVYPSDEDAEAALAGFRALPNATKVKATREERRISASFAIPPPAH